MWSLPTFRHNFFTMANISFLFSAPGYFLLMNFPNSLILTLPSPIASMISFSVIVGAGVSSLSATVEFKPSSCLIGEGTVFDALLLLSTAFVVCGFHSPSGKLFSIFLSPFKIMTQFLILFTLKVGSLCTCAFVAFFCCFFGEDLLDLDRVSESSSFLTGDSFSLFSISDSDKYGLISFSSDEYSAASSVFCNAFLILSPSSSIFFSPNNSSSSFSEGASSSRSPIALACSISFLILCSDSLFSCSLPSIIGASSSSANSSS
ncbi:hypothetical protein AWRI1631_74070 [Saccharomyces cerevisiae AWRI1631]|uniref:Uncharacterized protein n=1 Tax=Saccharomyces cerevisiae (strain AWRI1631) TaxID=545124 RepID=B5VJC7_YEAS6|nr:hypothetical protein AWRI1631_74070 [Saccharomyces cerevisiae AWRI1631]